MKPEFKSLVNYFRALYVGFDLTEEYMKKALVQINLCSTIAESDKERTILIRAKEWYNRRAAELGLMVIGSNTDLVKRGYTDDDLRFLESLRIKNDEAEEE